MAIMLHVLFRNHKGNDFVVDVNEGNLSHKEFHKY